MRHRLPKSIHSQVEAVFHSIRSIRESKTDSSHGIRSFGAWKIYRYEAHRFAQFLFQKGRTSILDTLSLGDDLAEYLEIKLVYYTEKRRSRQTMETLLSALGKFEYAINCYISLHSLEIPRLETEHLRKKFYAKSKKMLRKSSKIFDNRAYLDPIRLIAAIANKTFQLQASLQFEGGLRAEGVGAPSNRALKNPLTSHGLRGIGTDPVTGLPVGIVASVEKGGKETDHFVSIETYRRLESYISSHGKLESVYSSYVEAINQAARATNQFKHGRGSHGLKYNFAQERYLQCTLHGMTHEQALQQSSLELSHFRLQESLTYTKG